MEDYTFPGGWKNARDAADKDARARALCRELEAGRILYFPKLPYDFPSDEREFLLSRQWNELRLHKNVSYRPADDVLRGFSGDHGTVTHLHHIVRSYSAHVIDFLRDFLRPYAGQMEAGLGQLPAARGRGARPFAAQAQRPAARGRVPAAADARRAHPARVYEPARDEAARVVRGRRLRLAGGKVRGRRPACGRFAAKNGFLRRSVSRWAAGMGLARLSRTPYDQFMLRFHDYLKENDDFQRNSPKVRLEFPPLATWMVFTDGVAHAAMSGQFAIEQTLLIPPEALVAPESAPYRILERVAGGRLC